MLKLLLAPMPTPTATVTAPVPGPVINVYGTAPSTPEGTDWAATLMDGFIGAILAGIIGGLVAVAVAFYLVSRERHAKREDRERDEAARLLGALFGFEHAVYMRHPERDTFAAIYALIESAYVVMAPRPKDPHKAFRIWLEQVMTQMTMIQDRDISWEDQPEEKMDELRDHLQLMAKGVRGWMVDPPNWSPPRAAS